jgi:hypothetical protein
MMMNNKKLGKYNFGTLKELYKAFLLGGYLGLHMHLQLSENKDFSG